MAADQDPLDDDQDPTEDTQDVETEDTVEADDGKGPVDWEARYKEQQKLFARQQAELGQWRSGKQVASEDDTADEPASESTDADSGRTSRLEEQSWVLVEDRYGEKFTDAYRAYAKLADKAVTPLDAAVALEAYRELMNKSEGLTAAPAGTAGGDESGDSKDTDKRLRPRVDTNRSDSGPDSTEADLEGARKSGKLDDFAAAAAKALFR